MALRPHHHLDHSKLIATSSPIMSTVENIDHRIAELNEEVRQLRTKRNSLMPFFWTTAGDLGSHYDHPAKY
jgi:hypothetical protein